MTPEPHIAIIILNWNGKKDTLACLDSIAKIDYKNFETLVVDNGSTDDSLSAISSNFPHLPLIATGQNLGFAEGNNVGIRWALARGVDYFFLLNNDTTVDPGILKAFLEKERSSPECGILGAKICLFEKPTHFDHLGGTWNARTASFDLACLRQKDEGAPPPLVDYVCGCALFVKREVFEKIGLLEPRFFLIWEEADFCFRARKAGYQIATAPEARLLHKVSASFVGGKPHSTYFWWRNRLFWIERNCTPREKLRLYLRVLLPEIAHLYKLKHLKSAQLFFQRHFGTHTDLSEKEGKVLKYKAALGGVKDYLLRRFGNGPSWIYGKKKL
jgi:GT2 family glycosyltransferase